MIDKPRDRVIRWDKDIHHTDDLWVCPTCDAELDADCVGDRCPACDVVVDDETTKKTKP